MSRDGSGLDELTRRDLAWCARRLGSSQADELLARGELSSAAEELHRIARAHAGPLGDVLWETLGYAFAELGRRDLEARCLGHLRAERMGFVDVEMVWQAPVRMGACTFFRVGEQPELATAATYVDDEGTRLVPDDWSEWLDADPGAVVEARDPSTGERLASGTLRVVSPRAIPEEPTEGADRSPPPESPARVRPGPPAPDVDRLRFYQVDAIRAAWSQASARRLASGPALERYIAALEGCYERVAAGCFELALDPQVLAMAAHGENWKYARPVEHLFALPGVALHRGLRGARDVDRERFGAGDLFELAACLGRTLARGGAYTMSGERAPSSALRLGAECAEEVLGDDAGLALFSGEPWCEFFFGVAWDLSVVVIVPAARRVTVIVGSDTD